MLARISSSEEYQDLELATLAAEEKGEVRNARATQTSPAPRRNSSTCLALESLGFYPELSLKKKLLLLFCALLAAYETFMPVENGSNDFLGLITEESKVTQGVSKGIASLLSFIILIATLRGMGKGLRNLELYSERVDDHSKQLIDVKNQLKTQGRETAQLRSNLTSTLDSLHGRQTKGTDKNGPVAILGASETTNTPINNDHTVSSFKHN